MKKKTWTNPNVKKFGKKTYTGFYVVSKAGDRRLSLNNGKKEFTYDSHEHAVKKDGWISK